MNKIRLIIPTNLVPQPSESEMTVAWLLGMYFKRDVQFVVRAGCKTADYRIGSKYWELKTPRGCSKRTVQHVLQKAAQQSENVIIDARFMKMPMRTLISRLGYERKFIPRIKHILVIDKNKKVIELK